MNAKIFSRPMAGAALLLLFVTPGKAYAQTVGVSRTRIHDPEAEAEQKLLADAQAALNQKDYPAAAQKYQDYLAKKPGDAYAHFQLGYAYTAMRRPGDAKPEYAKAVELDPKMGAAYLNLGMTLLELGDASGAAEPLEKAAGLSPSDAHARFLVGLALERAGKVTQAIEQYQAAEKLDNKNMETRAALGRALLASNRPADAEAEFRAEIALRPDAPDAAQAHLGLAQSLIAEKKSDEATAELDNYLKSRPNDSNARIERASILIDAGKYEDGIAELHRAAAVEGSVTADKPAASAKPENLRVLSLRAQAYLGEKNYDAAIPVLLKAAALAPRDPQFPAALGHAYLAKKDYPNALRTLTVAFKMEPSSNDVLNDLVAAEYYNNNYQAALQALDLLSQRRQNTLGDWFVRATCYDKLGDVPHALDAYRKFLQLNKDENSDMYFVATARVRTLERELKEKKR